jgi:hypothetical protein
VRDVPTLVIEVELQGPAVVYVDRCLSDEDEVALLCDLQHRDVMQEIRAACVELRKTLTGEAS